MIHLDTSFLVESLGHDNPQAITIHALMASGENFCISAVAWGEFMCGPLSDAELKFARLLLPEPLPLEPIDAELGAKLFNDTGRRRGTLNDCFIAATALRHQARLATANTKHFSRFKAQGLLLL